MRVRSLPSGISRDGSLDIHILHLSLPLSLIVVFLCPTTVRSNFQRSHPAFVKSDLSHLASYCPSLVIHYVDFDRSLVLVSHYFDESHELQ